MKVSSLTSQSWTSMTTLRDEATKDPSCISSPLPQSVIESSAAESSLPDGIRWPRLAKDETYAMDILNAWNQDFETEQAGNHQTSAAAAAATATTTTIHSRNSNDTYGCTFPYTRCDGVQYSGHLVIPSNLHKRIMNPNSTTATLKKVPVVILFHTGAGPQDIFNRYKADQLARQSIWSSKKKNNILDGSSNDDDHDGDEDDEADGDCIIFIADIVSDFVGWTWGDRQKYWKTRVELLEISSSTNSIQQKEQNTKSGEYVRTTSDGKNTDERQRTKLRQTLSAIVDAVKSIDIVDSKRIAAMGFCLGGQPILELGRMQVDGIVGLISFHGIFDGVDQLLPKEVASSSASPHLREVLICNGKNDPYVPESDLSNTVKIFETQGWTTTVLNFENAMHNFSNPRTKYDDPDAPFGYNEDAASKSWNEALHLLQRVFEL